MEIREFLKFEGFGYNTNRYGRNSPGKLFKVPDIIQNPEVAQ